MSHQFPFIIIFLLHMRLPWLVYFSDHFGDCKYSSVGDDLSPSPAIGHPGLYVSSELMEAHRFSSP